MPRPDDYTADVWSFTRGAVLHVAPVLGQGAARFRVSVWLDGRELGPSDVVDAANLAGAMGTASVRLSWALADMAAQHAAAAFARELVPGGRRRGPAR